nr:BamA/TamA family outer membrane protein [Deltaproteobacteria bacterium]
PPLPPNSKNITNCKNITKTVKTEKNTPNLADSKPVKIVKTPNGQTICKPAYPLTQLDKLLIEKIQIQGKNSSKREFIKKRIPIQKGDLISPDDLRFKKARVILLALGIFKEVNFSLKKGSERGKVILIIELIERGTLIVTHIFGGSSRIVPFWLGLGMEEKNFLGRAITLGFTGVITAKANIMGGENQGAFETYVYTPETFSVPISSSLSYSKSSEFYRTYGAGDDSNPNNFLPLNYHKTRFKVSTFFPIKKFFFHLGLEESILFADLPSERIRHFEDGTSRNVNFNLKDGLSYLGAINLNLVYDSRDKLIMPRSGTKAVLKVRMAASDLLSNYSFFKTELEIKKYLSWKKHTLSFNLFGGMVIGSPPIFEKYFIGDLPSLIPKRPLGLNLSVASSPNFLNNNIGEQRWGKTAFKAGIRYDYTFMQGKGFVYKGNFFASSGIFTLFSPVQMQFRDKDNLWQSTPVDLSFDFGIIFDTRIGIFTFSISNILGRLPI